MSDYAVFWSGGKDGCLANNVYSKLGNRCKKLIVFVEKYESEEFISKRFLNEQSKNLGVPIEIYEDITYGEFVLQAVEACRKDGIFQVVFGDTKRIPQMIYKTAICLRNKVTPVFPLSTYTEEQLARMYIDMGYKIIVSSYKKSSFGRDVLGIEYTEEFLHYLRRTGNSLIGENGEFHTIVVNGPDFFSEVPYQFKCIQNTRLFSNMKID